MSKDCLGASREGSLVCVKGRGSGQMLHKRGNDVRAKGSVRGTKGTRLSLRLRPSVHHLAQIPIIPELNPIYMRSKRVTSPR